MKTSPHRQAILVFGIAVPVFLIIAISVAMFVGHSKLKTSFETKVAALERYQTAQTQVTELEAFLSVENRREKTAYWTSKVEQDVVESLTKNLDTILAKYDSEVLRQTEMGQAPGAGTLGVKSKHPHSRMQLSFEGGFKPMQLLLAELETEMPHLVLESLTINPKPATSEGGKSTLQFGVVYLCWEKPKEAPIQP
jgi:Sec-independent protein translocase protein TatA